MRRLLLYEFNLLTLTKISPGSKNNEDFAFSDFRHLVERVFQNNVTHPL